jgi:hypothetical protein
MMASPKIHYVGGTLRWRTPMGGAHVRLGGWPPCTIGARAYAIRNGPHHTADPRLVTCAGCRRALVLAEEKDRSPVEQRPECTGRGVVKTPAKPTKPSRPAFVHEPVLPRPINHNDLLAGLKLTPNTRWAVVLTSGYVVEFAPDPATDACLQVDPKSTFRCSRLPGHRGAHVACEIDTDETDTQYEGRILAVWK